MPMTRAIVKQEMHIFFYDFRENKLMENITAVYFENLEKYRENHMVK